MIVDEPNEEPSSTEEKGGKGEEKTQQGLKRKLSLTIKNAPKMHDKKKFARFLKDQDVSYSKITKPFGQQIAQLFFETEADKVRPPSG